MSVGIIDYGMGNLRSVQKAFEFLGYKAEIITSAKEILSSEKLVLPGVGAFADAIEVIRAIELDKAIKEALERDKPFLGICLGMQLLFDVSFENGEYEGLGILPGEIRSLKEVAPNEKIPHIGWNSLDFVNESVLFKGLPQPSYTYFVHSYFLKTSAPIVTATTFYGNNIQVAVEKNNIFACQFHPEKSGKIGLKILDNFGGIGHADLSCN